MAIDDEFLRGAGERLEGYFPGMSERIDKLYAEQLGRGIIIQRSSSAPPSPDELIGYILPVSRDQREHVVLFKSGDIIITSSVTTLPHEQTTQQQANQQYADQHYIEIMSPGPIPIELGVRSYPSIDRFVNDPNSLRVYLRADIKMRNSNPETVPHILVKVDQAMAIAKEAKAERDKAREDSAKQLMSKIDELLDPKRPNPPVEPLLPSSPPTEPFQ